MFRALADPILSVLYPQECHVCGGGVDHFDDGVACRDCWETTRLFTGHEELCAKCGAYLAGSAFRAGSSCPECKDHHYDRAIAVGIYEKALAASALYLKRTPFLSNSLIRALVSRFNDPAFQDITLIIPVPLSAGRRLERGFNQAEFLADVIARGSGLRFDRHSLVRTVHTPSHRVAMDRRARELTVANAFDVTRPKLVAGAQILLVDDIFTSGATASYCAKALKKHGAQNVMVLTLARAV